jgi:hypothetical protein
MSSSVLSGFILLTAMLVNALALPPYLVRKAEIQTVSQILAEDGDLMVAGVSGSGRRSLIQWAAQQVGARIINIDCLRATTSSRFLTLLAEGLLGVFATPQELNLIEQWTKEHPLKLEQVPIHPSLVWKAGMKEEWGIFQSLLTLPQVMAELLDCRVVFVFQNFPHIRSWDRSGEWEAYLRQEVKRQSRINYVIIATIPEPWADESHLQVMTLAPVPRLELQDWSQSVMAAKSLQFDQTALELFLDYMQGHLGDAIALARRIVLEYQVGVLEGYQNLASYSQNRLHPAHTIQIHHVRHSMLALIEDRSLTFESLLLLLPPIQARVLESLAIDPTDSPHAKDYVRIHQLSKGGGLQGALSGLEQKGLIHGPKLGYRVAMPLFAFWLKQRLS